MGSLPFAVEEASEAVANVAPATPAIVLRDTLEFALPVIRFSARCGHQLATKRIVSRRADSRWARRPRHVRQDRLVSRSGKTGGKCRKQPDDSRPIEWFQCSEINQSGIAARR
jgi:hypothetical protein